MGLDMKAVFHKGDKGGIEFHEWRNDDALNELMMRLCVVKEVSTLDEIYKFCNFFVELNGLDLDALEKEIKAGSVFSSDDKAGITDGMEFIKTARRHLAEGDTVSYWANW